jgi:hypothetical protein
VPQSRSRQFGRDKNFILLPGIEVRYVGCPDLFIQRLLLLADWSLHIGMKEKLLTKATGSLFSPCPKGSSWPTQTCYRTDIREATLRVSPTPPPSPVPLAVFILYSSNVFIYSFNFYYWFIWDLFI